MCVAHTCKHYDQAVSLCKGEREAGKLAELARFTHVPRTGHSESLHWTPRPDWLNPISQGSTVGSHGHLEGIYVASGTAGLPACRDTWVQARPLFRWLPSLPTLKQHPSLET